MLRAGRPKREQVLTTFHDAILGVEKVHDPAAALSVLEEAGKSLKTGCADRCGEVFDSVYDSIVHAGPMTAANRARIDRSELFRRFLHLVAKVDLRLVKYYVDRLHNERAGIRASTWQTANDILDEDLVESLDIARQAAMESTDFPDAALNYLRRLPGSSAQEVSMLARTVIERSPDFDANSRLELLAFLCANERVAQLTETSLVDREVADEATTGPAASDGLVSTFVRQMALNHLPEPRTDYIVVSLAEARLSGRPPQIIASLKRAKAHDAESLTPEIIAKADAAVEDWISGNAAKKVSRDPGEAQSSREEMARNRAALTHALSLAREGKFDEALDLLSALPSPYRGTVCNSILLVAADAISSPDELTKLLTRAQIETQWEFVFGYIQLMDAKARSQQPPETEHDLWTELGGAEASAARQKNVWRLTLQLGATAVWTDIDHDTSFAALDRTLKDLNEDKYLDGYPVVVMKPSVPGYSTELKFGAATLYQVIRKLAKQDIDSTLTHLAASTRDDIRLHGIVAACAEFLGKDAAAADPAGAPVKQ